MVYVHMGLLLVAFLVQYQSAGNVIELDVSTVGVVYYDGRNCRIGVKGNPCITNRGNGNRIVAFVAAQVHRPIAATYRMVHIAFAHAFLYLLSGIYAYRPSLQAPVLVTRISFGSAHVARLDKSGPLLVIVGFG